MLAGALLRQLNLRLLETLKIEQKHVSNSNLTSRRGKFHKGDNFRSPFWLRSPPAKLGYREQVPISAKRPRHLLEWAAKAFKQHGETYLHVHQVIASAAASRTKETGSAEIEGAASTEKCS